MKTVAVIVPGGIVNILNSTLTKLINSLDSVSFRKNSDTTKINFIKNVFIHLTFYHLRNYNAGYFKTSYGKTS